METAEERLAYLEGRVEDHSNMVSDLRKDMVALRTDMNQRFLHLESKMDGRFDRVDQRFDSIESKMSRQFMWLAGMLMTTLIAMLGTMGAVIAAMGKT